MADGLEELYIYKLQDFYSVENQLLTLCPKIH